MTHMNWYVSEKRKSSQEAWKFGKTPKEWHLLTGVFISIFKESDHKECINYKEMSR